MPGEVGPVAAHAHPEEGDLHARRWGEGLRQHQAELRQALFDPHPLLLYMARVCARFEFRTALLLGVAGLDLALLYEIIHFVSWLELRNLPCLRSSI